MPREFVGRVPVGTGDNPNYVAIEWDEMTIDHVTTWHDHVQPSIRVDPNRSDRLWNWRLFFLYLLPYYSLRGFQPKFLAAVAYSKDGGAVPIGMLLILTNYPRIDSSGAKAVFTCFLTSAPATALAKLGVDRIPDLGRYLVDSCLVLSVNGNLDGHYWLRCATEGGQRLLNFYTNKCKLKRFPKSKALPVIYPKNNGKFFFSYDTHSESLLFEFDRYRVTV